MTKVYVVESTYGDNWESYSKIEAVFTDVENAIEWSEKRFGVVTETRRSDIAKTTNTVAVISEKEVEYGADYLTYSIYERELIEG